MSEGQKELFAFLAAAFTTLIGLFVVQEVYATWVDVSFYESRATAPANAKVAATRATEAQALAAGRMSIEESMKALAERGRGAFPAIKAQQSEDVSAMTGWIHRHDFKPYVAAASPAPAPAPAALPSPVPAPPVEQGDQPTATLAAPAAPAPGAAKPAAPAAKSAAPAAKPAAAAAKPAAPAAKPVAPAPKPAVPAPSQAQPKAAPQLPPAAPPGLKLVPQPRREAPKAEE